MRFRWQQMKLLAGREIHMSRRAVEFRCSYVVAEQSSWHRWHPTARRSAHSLQIATAAIDRESATRRLVTDNVRNRPRDRKTTPTSKRRYAYVIQINALSEADAKHVAVSDVNNGQLDVRPCENSSQQPPRILATRPAVDGRRLQSTVRRDRR